MRRKLNRDVWLLLLFAALAVSWRLIPHMPNFAPLGAVAVLAGRSCGWRRGVWIPAAAFMLSDAVIGFYAGFEWTWLGYVLIVGAGALTRRLPWAWAAPLGALGTSSIFYLVSNFGVWLASGMYAPSISGLIACYVLALPFFGATILSDMVFVMTFSTVIERWPWVCSLGAKAREVFGARSTKQRGSHVGKV
ncbi:MAG TPA: DUF6580 family putative transport protein [Candidatus Saccharimonadaceae bacterium]|nr:DUF6580 family putative transport protein [Candidatus Saccharimonadaceae bacterium]